jgi:toxin-antitoxin system PIN domain toxin
VDANVLIALSVTDHEYHDRAATWSVAVDTFAVCPIVEGSLVRFLTRMGAGAPVAISLLERLRSGGRCEFWPDSLSYVDADLAHVVGHRQVTDAYLVALARSRHTQLATFDAALKRTVPDAVALID